MSNLLVARAVVYAAIGTPQGEIDEPEREVLLGAVDTRRGARLRLFPRCTKSASVHTQAGQAGSPPGVGGGGFYILFTSCVSLGARSPVVSIAEV